MHRVIDSIDWLSGSDADFADDEELAEFSARLEDLGAVVIYPVGLVVWASYGAAGKQARSLIRAGRSLARAQNRVDRLTADVYLIAREIWAYREDTDRDNTLDAAVQTGDLSSSEVGVALVGDSEDSDWLPLLLREFDGAHAILRNAQSQVRLLGGDPSPAMRAMSPRQAMDIVRSMPHEPRALTVERGALADGIVESPLRDYRDDRLEALRSRYRARLRRTGG